MRTGGLSGRESSPIKSLHADWWFVRKGTKSSTSTRGQWRSSLEWKFFWIFKQELAGRGPSPPRPPGGSGGRRWSGNSSGSSNKSWLEGDQVLHVHQGAVEVVVGVEILLDLQTRAGWIVHLTTLQTIHVSYSVTILRFLLSPQRESVSVGSFGGVAISPKQQCFVNI